MLNGLQSLTNTVNQIGSIISTKLSPNQSLSIQSDLMQLNFKQTFANDFKQNLETSVGAITMPSDNCATLNLDKKACENSLITSQV